ncbi:kelch-like protein 10 [Genypterus blacodes]|uniref:kelch-like protein 10 n=1 Tax=Genypterus blacodes TaxID=154954 RepID=UPI003F770449
MSSPGQGLVYKLDYGSPSIIRLIIEFAYTGNVEVTKDNSKDLYMASQYFEIPSLTDVCSTFMEQQLCVKNCIEIWHSKGFKRTRLSHSAYLFIACHFSEVCTSPNFLELSVEELSQIIEDDKLNVKGENVVFDAALRWINHSPQERRGHITRLLPKVRLGLLTSEFFTNNVKNNHLVKSHEELEETVRMTEILISERTIFSNGINHPLARPRLPVRILLAIGGCEDSGLTDKIETFDTCTDLWVTVSNNEAARLSYHGSVFLNGSLYCVGGSNGDDVCKEVHRFDLDTRTWHQVAPMNSCRCFVSVTVLKGRIFAIGGFDGQDRLSTAECYDPETNQWKEIASLNKKRSDAGCTTLDGNVYICGGFNGNEYMNSCECFSPETNQWTRITPMNARRSGLGVIAYEDRVYAVGGFNGVHRLKTVEAYNSWTEIWYELSTMEVPRSNFGIEVVDDSIYVIGGYNQSAYLADVEFYNLASGVWCKAAEMKVPRCALGCCVVHGLNNMGDYAAPRDTLPLSSLDTNNYIDQ